jgi:hypothetical protein
MPSPPKLDLPLLQDRCQKLRNLLRSHSATEPDAALCLRELTPLFDHVMSGGISAPVSGPAPCGYYFHEGSLRKSPSLEHAYSEFSMALQGVDAQSLLGSLGKKPPG